MQLLPFRETALPIKKALVRTSVHPRRMDISYGATTCARMVSDLSSFGALNHTL
jgi:hypothetical protein